MHRRWPSELSMLAVPCHASQMGLGGCSPPRPCLAGANSAMRQTREESDESTSVRLPFASGRCHRPAHGDQPPSPMPRANPFFCAMADWRDLSFSSWLCVMKNNTTELEMTRLISAVRIAILALLGIGPLYLTIALALSAPASATQARSRTSKPSARQITCNWWACRPVAKGCRLVKPYREHFGDPSNGVEVCKDGSGRHRLDTPS